MVAIIIALLTSISAMLETRRTAIAQHDGECSVHQHGWRRPFLHHDAVVLHHDAVVLHHDAVVLHHDAVADGAPGSREALMKGVPMLLSGNEILSRIPRMKPLF